MAYVRHGSCPLIYYAPESFSRAESSQVKGSDWLGDQDAIHYMCREAPRSVYEVGLVIAYLFLWLIIILA
jgi:hypothetical protein